MVRKQMKTVALVPILGCVMLVSCKRYEVRVRDAHGSPVQNAHVFLSYVSDPNPLKFVTDSSGIAILPAKRAKEGGWGSIIAVYYDASGIKHSGSLHDSHPTFPVTVTVNP